MASTIPPTPDPAPPRAIRVERIDMRDGFAALRQHKWGFRVAIALIAAMAMLVLLWVTMARGLPDAKALLNYEPPLPTNVRGHDGTPIHSYARERRVQLGFDDYPKLVVNAFISAEDKTFFSHGGVDYLGIVSALFDNARNAGSGRRARGASTITQQVAKNLLLGNEYSVGRKIKEALLAYRIEGALSKQQILELYLNQIPLGRNSFGVQAAARAYFNKDVGELTLPEAAFLATLPKAPETYGREKNAARALDRRAFVLREMKANGFISTQDEAHADAAPLGILPRVAKGNDSEGDYFLEEVRRQLIDKFGERAADGPYSIYAGGLWVRTSLDPKMQVAAQDALRGGLLRYATGRGWTGPVGRIEPGPDWAGKFAAANIATTYKDWRTAVVISKSANAATIGLSDGTTATMPSAAASNPAQAGGTAFAQLRAGDIVVVAPQNGWWSLRNVPEISGGMVVENPHTGQVMAMQGGFDARLQSFNRATQAKRQPGSAFKPFVYAAALDHGMTPASIIIDGPFCVYQGARLGQKCFKNFGGEGGAGAQTMRWGVEQSRNLMTVRAASQTGMDNVVKLASVLGIPADGPYPKVLAIALGAGDTTVTKLVNAYAILANNGRALTSTMVDVVQDRRGKVIYRADLRACERCNQKEWDGGAMPRPAPRTKQLVDPMTAYQVVHILEGVIQRGTATVLKDLNRPIFGKTGTTTGPTNVWFVGGSTDLVGGVYLGYDTPRSMGAYAQGGRIAAPVFDAFAKVAMKDMPVKPLRATGGVRMVRIERRSGHKVFGAFPVNENEDSSVIWEAFKPESEPRRSLRGKNDPVLARPVAAPAGRIARRAAARAPAPRPDSDFLQRQGGIY